MALCLHPDDSERTDQATRASLQGGRITVESRVPKGGEVRWFRAFGQVYYDGTGTPVRITGLSIDITELVDLRHALEEANAQKDRFLSVVGHELRQPLSVLNVICETLAQKVSDPQVLEKSVAVLHRSVAHLRRLADDLLDVSRVQRGELSLRSDTFDLRRVLEADATHCSHSAVRRRNARIAELSEAWQRTRTAGDASPSAGELVALQRALRVHPAVLRQHQATEELVALLRRANGYLSADLELDFAETAARAGGACCAS